jgi:A/G-specific adenine glycosylase
MSHLKAIQEKLLDWYERNRRTLPWRKTSEPYAIWVSEVMLQQTQVKTVIPYYERFLSAFPNPNWPGGSSGSAETLGGARILCPRPQPASGRPKHRGTPRRGFAAGLTSLKSLPGIGDYVAAAISSIAFGKPNAVVDGNVKRVLARFHKMDPPVNHATSGKAYQTARTRFLINRSPAIQPGHDGVGRPGLHP